MDVELDHDAEAIHKATSYALEKTGQQERADDVLQNQMQQADLEKEHEEAKDGLRKSQRARMKALGLHPASNNEGVVVLDTEIITA